MIKGFTSHSFSSTNAGFVGLSDSSRRRAKHPRRVKRPPCHLQKPTRVGGARPGRLTFRQPKLTEFNAALRCFFEDGNQFVKSQQPATSKFSEYLAWALFPVLKVFTLHHMKLWCSVKNACPVVSLNL